MRACYQSAGLRKKQLEQQFPQCARSTIYKHKNIQINITPYDKRGKNKEAWKNEFLRQKDLEKNFANFTPLYLKTCALRSGLEHVSNRIIRRQINKLRFNYLRPRKKRLLSVKDLKLRRNFYRKVTRKRLGPEFWRHGISLYLDGTVFVYKNNPMDQATAPTAR